MAEISIEVAYAEPKQQHIETLHVSAGTTVAEVLALPLELKKQYPKMIINDNNIGIFSKHVDMSYILRHGDRLEIYRPLIIDPKEARRNRARGGNA